MRITAAPFLVRSLSLLNRPHHLGELRAAAHNAQHLVGAVVNPVRSSSEFFIRPRRSR